MMGQQILREKTVFHSAVNYINTDIIPDEEAAVPPSVYLLHKLFRILSCVRVTMDRVLN
jgi:hypothetical protein